MAKTAENFESAIKKLEAIVSELEETDLSLDKSLQLFEEGIKQTRFCEKKLSEAEGKVEKLISENGDFKKAPLDL